jgi:hypothetical protein
MGVCTCMCGVDRVFDIITVRQDLSPCWITFCGTTTEGSYRTIMKQSALFNTTAVTELTSKSHTKFKLDWIINLDSIHNAANPFHSLLKQIPLPHWIPPLHLLKPNQLTFNSRLKTRDKDKNRTRINETPHKLFRFPSWKNLSPLQYFISILSTNHPHNIPFSHPRVPTNAGFSLETIC